MTAPGETTRHLLLIAYFFPPDRAVGALRAASFAREIPRHRFSVTVLTRTHDAGGAESDESVRVVRVAPPVRLLADGGPAYAGQPMDRGRRAAALALEAVLLPDRFVLWAPAAVRAALCEHARRPFDAVLATFSPATDFVIGAALARRRSIPLFLDYRDLWTTSPGWQPPTPLHRAALRALEGGIARRSRAIVTTSPGATENIRRQFSLPEGRVETIFNGIFEEEAAILAQRHRPEDGRCRIVHVGAFYRDQNPDSFLDVVRRARADGDLDERTVSIRFVGNVSADLPARAGLEGLLEVIPTKPHLEALREIADADILLLVYDVASGPYRIPVKFTEYLAARRPILALCGGDSAVAGMMGRARLGWVAAPDDPRSIRAGLVASLAEWRAGFRRTEPPEHLIAQFDRRKQAARLAQLMHEALS